MSLLRVGERNDGKHVHYGQHLPLQSEAGADLPAVPLSSRGGEAGGGGWAARTAPVVKDGQVGAGQSGDRGANWRVAARDVLQVDLHHPHVLELTGD